VYLHKEAGELKTAVLPVVGKGLWSTMYGFLALGPDGDTVKGLVFYSHGETPGLGGEVDSEKFKAQFRGQKRLFDDEAYAFAILKAGRAQDRPEHQADGISGATITCRGVDEMIKYWVSVYGPYLAVLKGGG
ncbi:MAG: NADH:ubiquinone reductase (Na(+)-transporting) subunit C, partial [Planctomycetes bacterium]|nr:NADH:ubiquinone reductase (Na(+)-transporting) subunit C [Planctomycetota bacterium]